jgi:hypothetical protein
MIYEPIVRSAQTIHLSCVKISTLQMDRNELPLEPRQHGVPSSVSKAISDPMVRLVQTVRLTCAHTNTITDRTVTRLHMCHITLEFYRLRPKRFPSLWYIWRK